MNKISYLSVVAVAIALAASSAISAPKKPASATPTTSPSATAATSPNTASSPAASPERAIPFHGMISAVDAKANSFTVAGKEKSRTFRVTSRSAITKNGNAATMKDVVANEEARGSYWKAADGSLEIKTLKIGETKASPTASASPSASASPR